MRYGVTTSTDRTQRPCTHALPVEDNSAAATDVVAPGARRHSSCPVVIHTVSAKPSVERTCQGPLRAPCHAAYVERRPRIGVGRVAAGELFTLRRLPARRPTAEQRTSSRVLGIRHPAWASVRISATAHVLKPFSALGSSSIRPCRRRGKRRVCSLMKRQTCFLKTRIEPRPLLYICLIR
jgi:hypothetical protein